MNVSAPFEAVVPSLDGPVLAALAGLASPATVPQVRRIIGVGSVAGVRKVLVRLARQGVLIETTAGAVRLYALNREHLAWPAIRILVGMRGALLDRLREAFDGWAARPYCAALYGSAARGDGDADSDIDILVVRRPEVAADDATWQAQQDGLREDVTAWTGNTCQIYDIGDDELVRHVGEGAAIVAAWRADAVTVAGPELRGLLRDLGQRGSA